MENSRIEENLQELEKRVGYRFRDKALLRRAMTHTSYANEHKKEDCQHNERLEFLGDAVLELVSSEVLFKAYLDKPEGDLTKMRASLVCEPTLAMCGREFGIDRVLLLGRGEEGTGGRKRDSIVSDGVEALIGAIYLDGGLPVARTFIERFILSDRENKQLFYDSKTVLQEMIQGKNIGSVRYAIVGESGPAHDKQFDVELFIGDERIACGTGHNKKMAEQQAAYMAIKKLKAQGFVSEETT